MDDDFVGVKFWNDRTRYSIQTNNSMETYLRHAKAKEGLNHWTESCGPTSAVTIIESMGLLVPIKTPGGYLPQPEDVLTVRMNDPRHARTWLRYRPDIPANSIPGNRIPQLYVPAVKEVFGVECSYIDGITFDQIASYLSQGNGVMLCLNNPGHYIPAVAYSKSSGVIVYHDPYPERFIDGNGWGRKMNRDEFDKNIRNFAVVFYTEV